MSEKESGSRIFFGWFVVGACFVVTMSMGETMWSFGVFFKPLQAEFQWNRTLVSSGYTAFLIAYSLAAVISGRLSDRYGPRPVILASGLLAGLGISLCSMVQSVNGFRFFLFLAGLGAGATWTVPIATVQRWFNGRPRAGLALSIVAAGVGIGAIIFAPLIHYLISHYGWRNAFLITGTLFFILIAASSPLVRRSPAEVPTSARRHAPPIGSSSGLRTSQVLFHPTFLTLAFGSCVTVIAFQIFSVHLVPFSIDLGITPMAAAAAAGLMGAFSIPGRMVAGPLSDRIGWKRTFSGSIFGMTLAAVWLFLCTSEWMLYGFAFLYGFFWGARSTSLNGAIGSFFGMRSVGELVGINAAISNIPGAFMPYAAGYIFDVFGSYGVVFASLSLLLLLAVLLSTFMEKPGSTVIPVPPAESRPAS